MLYYKNKEIEFYMNHRLSSPRYAGLARKALSYYLGDLYNPETFDHDIERMFRGYIWGYIKLKVFDNEPYDWALIDHFFRKFLFNQGYTFLTYDQSVLDKGYNGVMRGNLPEHHA